MPLKPPLPPTPFVPMSMFVVHPCVWEGGNPAVNVSGTGHSLVATVTYTPGGGGGVRGPKKKFVYLNSTSDFGPL